MQLSSTAVQVPLLAGQITRLLGLGGIVARWVRRGCGGPVVRRVCVRAVVTGIGTDVLLGAVPGLVAAARGEESLERVGRTLVRGLIISGASAAVTAVVVTVTGGLSGPVQLVLIILCAIATCALEAHLTRRLPVGLGPGTAGTVPG
jgi:hypothetical protein